MNEEAMIWLSVSAAIFAGASYMHRRLHGLPPRQAPTTPETIQEKIDNPPTPRGYRRLPDDEVIHTMVSKGRDNYGQVIETVSLRVPRYVPVCEWCRTDLALDEAGACENCGAQP